MTEGATRAVLRGGTIRPLERRDLPQVASAIAEGKPADRLARFLEQTLLDQPWADPEIPSLVYENGGEILGTIGASVRRMRFDGRPVRLVVSAYLWSHPRVRRHAIGLRLLRALLAGPQDVTVTDGATETVRRMWEALGGRAVHLSCFSYLRVLRPARLAIERALGGRLRDAGAALSAPLDLVAVRLAGTGFRPRSATESEPLSPVAMVEHLPSIASWARLRADYDAPYLEWLFARLQEIDESRLPWLRWERGGLFAELVRRDGRAAGWYVCHLRPGGLCRVLQIAARERATGDVLRHLFARAAERGASAVLGRLEPRLVAPIRAEHRNVYYRPRDLMLIHTRDHEILSATLAGDALLTRLDGEWWVS
ncbi:MAG TPA: hypothetical protein VNJ46_01465 [Gaiellaceae bacterium]|nr:hypothetical protein [Gaiellaceae bacterium]